MLSYLKLGALSSIEYSTARYNVRRAAKFSSFKAVCASRTFQSFAQCQGQPALAEAPSYEHGPVFETPGELARSQFPVTQDSPSTQLGAAPKAQDTTTQRKVVPLYYRDSKFDKEPYWQKIGRWKDVTEQEFLSHRWNIAKNVQGPPKLFKFLNEVLPENLPESENYKHIRTREAFIEDVLEGIKEAPMSIRLTPHILSVIDWNNPLEDPMRRQFIPMKSALLPDHPKLTLDSLHEKEDSPAPGLVHRYPEKVLFLATSVCGLYCRFCTRSYAVGGNTETVTKTPNKPIKALWEEALAYIASNPTIQDVVVSGGDSYYLLPDQLRFIGDRLLSIPHIRRFRIATKGLCVSPSRTLDPEDNWTEELVRLSRRGREMGKQVAMHTHFDHPREFSWVNREAAQRLFEQGVVVRNQSVLLRGVNDDVETMSSLIRELADNNIQPYYVYQCDMVSGVEDLRTPLQTILDLEQKLRGSIAGFMMPSFVVDLPGGGGKRLAASHESYDRKTGVSKFVAPAVTRRGKDNKVYEYHDPLAFCDDGGAVEKQVVGREGMLKRWMGRFL